MSKDNAILHCQPANTDKIHQLDADEILKDNEICCPPFEGCLWSSHPRVFLKLDDENKVECPYCKTLYTLSSTNTAEKTPY
jgi:uncharacterized Zn-finger protein